MKEGPVNGHVFRWTDRGLTCEKCRRGTRNQKYWLNIAQEECRGSKPTREEALKARLAGQIGVERLEGNGPWTDPHTGHRVALNNGAWECEACGRDFGQRIGRLGPRQRRCPGEVRQEVVRRVNRGREHPRGGGDGGAAGSARGGGQPSVLALLGAGVKRGREPVDVDAPVHAGVGVDAPPP